MSAYSLLLTIARGIRLRLLSRRVNPETFVYQCRDLGYGMGETMLLLMRFYQLDGREAKSISFLSPAWGEEMVKETSELHEHLWNWAEAEAKRPDSGVKII
ncbi:hypothetical protein RB623_27810 [Mesorhizobium sp. LHD-90]|uniref:hypothetical protein n=1 Tax=Mesorhizobium sp. LHD-90 TaxID=3071414 RepID=UPI0027E115D2|nr:hypothetical protein [Mesorhizobium sp. LHD-90]MDQ6437878.1 hypothetical protein [Mesorhizobium sp. LHD-90]